MTAVHMGSMVLALTVWLASILLFLHAGAKFERSVPSDGWMILLFACVMQGVALWLSLI